MTVLSSLKSKFYRRRLERLLAAADDEGFCQLVWAVDAIQSDREAAGARVMRYPAKAATSTLTDNMHIQKWTLDTLMNELLTTPKKPMRGRHLNYQFFDAIAAANNMLRDLENADDGVSLGKTSVFNTMARLGHRQFEWQRSAANVIDLYRSLFLFGGPAGAAYFADQYGIGPQDFALCGFVAYWMFAENAAIARDYAQPELGVTPELFQATLNLIARPIEDIRRAAKTMRGGPGHVGYKPSVLRGRPCIVFDDRLRAPLRELLFARVTSGLYYDVIGEGGDVPREIGERFEEYCFGLLNDPWDDVDVDRSFNYPLPGQGKSIDAPDLRLRRGGETHIIAECKAKRMPLAARFGEEPLKDPRAQPGFNEVSKGVFQIWRYKSHVRQGFVPDDMINVDAVGVVITIDNWLTLARGRYDDFLSRARALADAEGRIIEADRCPVAFCSVSDLEQVLMTATFGTLSTTLREIATADFAGWHVAHVHNRHAPKDVERRPYPFADKIGELLPWWDALGEEP